MEVKRCYRTEFEEIHSVTQQSRELEDIYRYESEWTPIDEALRQLVGTNFSAAKAGNLVKATDIDDIGRAVSSTMHLREVWILRLGRKSEDGGQEPDFCAPRKRTDGGAGKLIVKVFHWTGRSWAMGLVSPEAFRPDLRSGG